MKLRLIFAILLLVLASAGCQRAHVQLLPSDLVGFWTADEPRYQGRFLELMRPYVIIGTGSKDTPVVQMVEAVQTSKDGDSTVYNISSTDLAGVHYEMTLLYNPAGGGVLRFRHQENISWKRLPENNENLKVASPANTPAPTPVPKKSAPKNPKAIR